MNGLLRRLLIVSAAALLGAGATVLPVLAGEFTSSELGGLTNMLTSGKNKGKATTGKSTSKTSKASTKAAKASVAMLPAKSETRYIQNEVLVETKTDIKPDVLQALATRNHLRLVETAQIDLLTADVHRFEITDKRTVRTVLAALAAEPAVLLAQPNYTYAVLQTTPATSSPAVPQYAADLLHLAAAHAIATGKGIKIGILDTGIADTPELAGSVAQRFDAAGPTQTDDLSHGTAIAGIVAAHSQLNGVAPGATLFSARAFVAIDGKPPASNSFVLLKGLDWLATSAAQIVNMSFAGPADPLFLKSVKAAHGKGIFTVAAAGNDGPKAAPDFPAADPNVFGVTAVDDANALLLQANRGDYIAVAAPGVDVLVLAPDGSYSMNSGTSIAAAHVSGAVALLLEHDPSLTPDALVQRLSITAVDLGAKGKDSEFGSGLIDPEKALSVKPPQ